MMEGKLKALESGFRPKKLIDEVAENLLNHYKTAELVDPYQVFQLLMNYWYETMQDKWPKGMHKLCQKSAQELKNSKKL
jgi:hypothetical protein